MKPRPNPSQVLTLTKAVREWRGVVGSRTGARLHPAVPNGERNVVHALKAIQLPVESTLDALASLTSYTVLLAWLNALESTGAPPAGPRSPPRAPGPQAPLILP